MSWIFDYLFGPTCSSCGGHQGEDRSYETSYCSNPETGATSTETHKYQLNIENCPNCGRPTCQDCMVTDRFTRWIGCKSCK